MYQGYNAPLVALNDCFSLPLPSAYFFHIRSSILLLFYSFLHVEHLQHTFSSRDYIFLETELYVLLASRASRDFVTSYDKSSSLFLFSSLVAFLSRFFFPLSDISFIFLRLLFLYLLLLSNSILGRFECCGSVTHGDGLYTKRISPADRTGSGSSILPLLRSLKLVSSFRPRLSRESFCFPPAVSFGDSDPPPGRIF